MGLGLPFAFFQFCSRRRVWRPHDREARRRAKSNLSLSLNRFDSIRFESSIIAGFGSIRFDNLHDNVAYRSPLARNGGAALIWLWVASLRCCSCIRYEYGWNGRSINQQPASNQPATRTAMMAIRARTRRREKRRKKMIFWERKAARAKNGQHQITRYN